MQQEKTFELNYLEQIDPRELTEKDAERLVELCRMSYTGITAREMIEMAAAARVQLWRASGGPDGLIVTEVLRHNSGKELNMWGLIGDGLFRYAKGMREDFVQIAKQAGARWLSGYTFDPRLNRIYSKLAGKHGDAFHRSQYLEDLES